MGAAPLLGTQGIFDAVLAPLTPEADGRLTILAFEDHLLRRFGREEIIRLQPGEAFRILRGRADEVWILVDGSADLDLEDTRAVSPTSGERRSIKIVGPTRLLLPFGVRMDLRAVSPTLLLRIMTHSETEDRPSPEAA
jgi:hypothetical protein